MGITFTRRSGKGRIFTPAQANRALPLVRRIVEDILSCGQELRACAETGGPRERELRERLRGLVAEIRGIGCEYKDWSFEVGVVDFPSEVDGRPAYLCWRTDEPSVTHYHGSVDGYTGRRPLPSGGYRAGGADADWTVSRAEARRARLEARSAHFGISLAGAVPPAECDCAAPHLGPPPGLLQPFPGLSTGRVTRRAGEFERGDFERGDFGRGAFGNSGDSGRESDGRPSGPLRFDLP